MLNLLRQNRINKWFSGIGQEAISVGVGLATETDDYLLPMHRNLGIFTSRKVPFYPLFCQLMGKADGYTLGRDRSFHFGIPSKNIVGMISHLAANMPVADGIALAFQLRKEQRIVVNFCGDGATSEGDFHEALNLAAVWKLPVLFVIENNEYALSTPVTEQYACQNLADRAAGYGIEGVVIDGNNIFEVIETISKSRDKALKGIPVLIEAKTFRIRGHEEASGTSYVSDKLIENWKEKDPIHFIEKRMLENNVVADKEEFFKRGKKLSKMFEEDLERALMAPNPEFDSNKEITDAGLIALDNKLKYRLSSVKPGKKIERKEIRFIDAVQLALAEAFGEDKQFLLIGQDIADYGGVFKVSEGFLERFGKERIRNTPIIESGAIGAAIGLALEGFKPVVEMQFADFISCAFNQIVNNLTKARYRWMPPLNVTIRAPHGAGVGAGPFHSQSPEGWFMQHPGLRILVPGTVEDARDMLYTALNDPNPVLFLEHKKLYRSLKANTTTTCSYTNLEKAAIRRKGSDLSIVTYGMGLHWALEAAEELDSQTVSVEVIDLRSLAPIDWETVYTSVKKTGKVLLLQEPSATLGPMSEVSSRITENCFEYLDAPVLRCSSLDTPVPFNRSLEQGYLAKSRLKLSLETLIAY